MDDERRLDWMSLTDLVADFDDFEMYEPAGLLATAVFNFLVAIAAVSALVLLSAFARALG